MARSPANWWFTTAILPDSSLFSLVIQQLTVENHPVLLALKHRTISSPRIRELRWREGIITPCESYCSCFSSTSGAGTICKKSPYLGIKQPHKQAFSWDYSGINCPSNWCRISSIHSMFSSPQLRLFGLLDLFDRWGPGWDPKIGGKDHENWRFYRMGPPVSIARVMRNAEELSGWKNCGLW